MVCMCETKIKAVLPSQKGVEVEDDFKLEIMTAIELPMKTLWPPRDKEKKLIPEVEVFD